MRNVSDGVSQFMTVVRVICLFKICITDIE